MMKRSTPALVSLSFVVLFGCGSGSGPETSGGGSGGSAAGSAGGGGGGVGPGGGGGTNAGGGAGTGAPDSGPMLPLLYAEPKDLTTDHDGASVRIAVSYSSGAFAPGDISQSLSLRQHPADTLVATTVASDKPDASWIGGAWVLHPTADLAPGWYALVLAKGVGYLNGARKRPDGGFEARFRVGSDPLLVAVGACASKDLTEFPKLRLDFSEAVTLPAGSPSIQVLVDGKPASCVVYDPPNEQNPSLGLTCTPPPSGTAPLSITVGSGIVATSSGLPLRTSQSALPRTFDVPPAAWNASCRSWNETEVPAD